MSKDFSDLWIKYSKTKTKEIRDELIISYAYLVKIVAGRLKIYMGKNVEYDDLTSYGVFGLIDAIDKFDYTKNIKFETYASLRIRGSILDAIRKNDWVPRSLRQKHKELEAVYRDLECELGRPATDFEVAEKLDISIEDLEELIKKTSINTLTSLEDFVDQNYESNLSEFSSKAADTPEKIAEKEATKQMLVDAIGKLPEKEQKVVYYYYFEELTLKEISKMLEVSESRISQLHSKAVMRLKGKLGDHKEILLSF